LFSMPRGVSPNTSEAQTICLLGKRSRRQAHTKGKTKVFGQIHLVW
jgi:hypothetical protein